MSEEVFTRLVDAHYAALYRFALSLARSPADAADLTQQTYYIWATKGSALRDQAKAKTWLFTTLYREFIRTRKRGGRISSIEDLPPGERDMPDLHADDVARLDNQVVMDALQEVDAVFRAPLTLFHLKDLSYHEIAEILDVPLGTVMSRLSRGKTHLRAALEKRIRGAKVIEFPQRKTP